MLMVRRVHWKVSLRLSPDFEAIIDRYGSLDSGECEPAEPPRLALRNKSCVRPFAAGP